MLENYYIFYTDKRLIFIKYNAKQKSSEKIYTILNNIIYFAVNEIKIFILNNIYYIYKICKVILYEKNSCFNYFYINLHALINCYYCCFFIIFLYVFIN